MDKPDRQGVCVGVVAIGRNEGARLRLCLRSAVRDAATVVYVDSGSSDGSVEFAHSLGVEVVQLDITLGFTAARARNAGLHRLREVDPAVTHVQFVDGDCELVEDWITAALEFLVHQPDYAVVCGRRREVEPDRNAYHAVTDIEWDTPIGESNYCGGDALMRVDALEAVNGYRDSLIAGEEPELCVRLRRLGWKIFRLDRDMTRHDIRMTSWRQWWRRSVRAGHAYAEGASLHGAPPQRHWVKERRSILVWALGMPMAAILLAWPTSGISLAGLLVAYATLVLKATWSTHRRGNISWRRAVVYGAQCVGGKLPQCWGVLQFLWPRAQHGTRQIIEYKTVPAGSGELPQ